MHQKATSEFKLELQSRNAQSRSKFAMFGPVWPWNLTDDPKLLQAVCIIPKPLVNSNLSYKSETLNWGQNWHFFVLCNLEIWWMILKNNRTPLLCYFKLWASFSSHMWVQTGVTVKKIPKLGQKIVTAVTLELWHLTIIFCMDITSVNGNYTWKLHDDTMRETLWKKYGRQTERQNHS